MSLDGYFSGELQNPGTPASAPDGHQRQDAGKRKLVNFTARYKATDRLTIFGRVENLLDYDYYTRPVYADAGLPIAFYIGMQLEF